MACYATPRSQLRSSVRWGAAAEAAVAFPAGATLFASGHDAFELCPPAQRTLLLALQVARSPGAAPARLGRLAAWARFTWWEV
jgi:hypothetical protein